jgi:putative polyhydroxyalkanoate system protein
MKIERKFSFTADEAKQRMQALTDYWHTKYGVKTDWNGNTGRTQGKVKGISFDARVDVAEKQLTCEADVGFLAERLGARSYIERKLDEYLDPSKSVTALTRG